MPEIHSCDGWLDTLGSVAPGDFYSELDALLATAPVYKRSIKYPDGSDGASATSLEGTMMNCASVERAWTSVENIELVDAVRGVVAAATAAGTLPMRTEVYSGLFPFMDGLKVMRTEMYTSMVIAASLVFVICVLLLGRVDVALLVFLMVVLTDVDVLGCYYFTDMSFEFLTSIILVSFVYSMCALLLISPPWLPVDSVRMRWVFRCSKSIIV